MSKLVTVVGATGTQGGSVIKALLNVDGYKLRAITRSRQSVEVVEANLNDLASLKAAFAGSYAIFGVTNYFEAFPTVGKEKAIEIEAQMGINLADAAAATPGLQHYIWSTLPNSRRIGSGRVIVPHYEGKNKVDDYIKSKRDLFKKTTYLLVPFYAQDIFYPSYQPFAIPVADPDIQYQVQATSPSVPWKLAGDVTINLGLFAKAILEHPEQTLPGRFVLASSDDMTPEEIVSAWAAP